MLITNMAMARHFNVISGEFNEGDVYTGWKDAQKWIAELCNLLVYSSC
jgi:hypothetical protein